VTELWTFLTPILLGDVLNPVLFAFIIYATGSNRPILNSSLMLAGHTAAYFVAGLIIAVGLERIMDALKDPGPLIFGFELVIGIALVGVALLSRTDKGRPDAEEKSEPLTPLKSFGLGMIVNMIGIPFAVPYFAALDQILKADLDTTGAVTQLVIYNLLYAAPFAGLIVMRAVMGKSARPMLDRINGWVEKASGFIMTPLLFLLGVALIIDSVYYFVTGEILYPL
jgi:cytochrome c biogenesis protein CcdA